MDLPRKLNRLTPARKLSRIRIAFALAVAVVADVLQFCFGAVPVAGLMLDDVIDVITMGLTMWALGFHILLLPTFVVKLIPVADMLPTWTGCAIAVIALRKRSERADAFIDVSVEPPVQKQVPDNSMARLP